VSALEAFAVPLTDGEFELFRVVLEAETGIVVSPAKRLLLKNRLRPLLQERGVKRFGDLLEELKNPEERFQVLSAIIDAVTTNLTYFFREGRQFNIFAEVFLPEMQELLMGRHWKKVAIWSAGCSTGQEVYSLAMLVREKVAIHHQESFRILGTDIDSQALERARQGVYREKEVKDLDPQRLRQHFLRRPEGDYQVTERLAKQVRFSPRNLVTPDQWGPGRYHAIFCRNVMIYFSPERRKQLVDEFFRRLLPGGYLFLGHAEGIQTRSHSFEYIAPSTYRRP
jgi:chemotaxis protein methyltransferase CheR